MDSNALKPVVRIEGDNKTYQFNNNFYDGLNRFKQNTDVISFAEYTALSNLGMLPAQRVVGDTLLKSPYDDKFYTIQEYEYAVMHDKVNHIAEIARKLGAVYYRCVIKVKDMQSRNISFTGTGSVKSVKLDTDWKKNEVFNLKSDFEMEQEYPQAAIPTIEAYNEAVKYAKLHHLGYDSGTQSLLSARKPDSNNNFLGKQKVSIKLSTDLNTNLDIAAELTEESRLFDFSVDYCKAVQIKKDVSLDVYYYFATPGEDNQVLINRAKQETDIYLKNLSI